jgi:hypothetical protein
MNQHSFRSPVVVTLETAAGRQRQYPIRDLSKAVAVMQWYGIRPLLDLRARNPGIWFITMAALACAQEHPEPVTIEHARMMFEALTKVAGILADLQ